jgi:hypothetical protein
MVALLLLGLSLGLDDYGVVEGAAAGHMRLPRLLK